MHVCVCVGVDLSVCICVCSCLHQKCVPTCVHDKYANALLDLQVCVSFHVLLSAKILFTDRAIISLVSKVKISKISSFHVN